MQSASESREHVVNCEIWIGVLPNARTNQAPRCRMLSAFDFDDGLGGFKESVRCNERTFFGDKETTATKFVENFRV
ncbi:hypothetical protein GCM10010525_20290 [Glutamicibacter bergerei]|uniref:Uncharacterized protein n=1 Tax=Glutamicibacter ardleyensis TaxID=225894 RepID=A0ABQ2D8L0_9MICC|nr:hypothetical protein GCM10007173_03720 [Glutamicibacter ardleyensis]